MSDTAHHGPAASLRRIRLIAGHTLGAALHQRLALLLAITGAALVLGARWLRDFNFGAAELKFIADFGLGAIGFFGTLLAALATAQLFCSEIESRAADCVLTRPVRRWEYLTGKFAGVVALLTLFVLTLVIVLGVVLAVRESQLGATLAPLPVFLQACALQWLKITLVAAMTLFVCSYAGSALFASCAGLLLALVAQLRGFAGGGSWAWLRVWPDLGLFDGEALLAAGHPASGGWLLSLAGYWAAYVLLFVALASYAFKRREF
ncbi:MAG: ABC transporter permease subunit [Lacunisphaera sp.]|nr:ABC transporter permease subunit [Lacunisphaera sp.]